MEDVHMYQLSFPFILLLIHFPSSDPFFFFLGKPSSDPDPLAENKN